ncbi:MAG TPA: hypothetical protein VMB50_02625 [Myxococcales bacterium]|nr:hypothetical protein [Myxococcales bacterium]
MLAALLVVALGVAPQSAREARELTRRSLMEYDTGDFDKSLADATRAFELDPLPAFLFNMAQCHRALHHWEQAEFLYHRYLGHVPKARNRKMVEALIAAVQLRQGKTPDVNAPQLPDLPAEPLVPGAPRTGEAEQATAKAEPGLIRDVDVYPVVVVRDDAPRMDAKTRWAWTATGLAAGFLAAGAGFGIGSLAEKNTIQGMSRPIEPAQAGTLHGNIQTMNALSATADVLFAAGGVSAVAAITLFLVHRRHPVAQTGVTLGPAPAGSGLGLSGSF